MGTPLDLLCGWVARQAGDAAGWFNLTIERLKTGAPDRDLHIALGFAPRRLGRADLELGDDDLSAARRAREDWHPEGWSIDGAGRVAALIAHSSPRPFADRFKDLRRTADVRETIALYRGLPLYPEPSRLAFEVGEALRSNMKSVFEAVAHHNPYPCDHFDEHRWNHMILKALFVGSRLRPIIGLNHRANPELARILLDYVHERRAASRPVPPELWRCVGPFAETVGALPDLALALNGSRPERQGAALSLAACAGADAAALLDGAPDLRCAIAAGKLTWDSLLLEDPPR